MRGPSGSELHRLLAQPEGPQLEFKASERLDLDGLLRNVLALANAGGRIKLGRQIREARG
jgi:hypothetical protein